MLSGSATGTGLMANSMAAQIVREKEKNKTGAATAKTTVVTMTGNVAVVAVVPSETARTT